MTHLPNDVARCTGEIGVGADRYCARRERCQRYIAWRDEAREDYRNVTVVMAQKWPCPIWMEVTR